MGRCVSCNVILTVEEEKRQSQVTKEYFNMCDGCLGTIAEDIPESFSEEDEIWDQLSLDLDD